MAAEKDDDCARLIWDTGENHSEKEEMGEFPAFQKQGVKACVTHSAKDVLQCIGGVAVLLPMIPQLDQPIKEASTDQRDVDARLAVQVCDLVAESVKGTRSLVQCSS